MHTYSDYQNVLATYSDLATAAGADVSYVPALSDEDLTAYQSEISTQEQTNEEAIAANAAVITPLFNFLAAQTALQERIDQIQTATTSQNTAAAAFDDLMDEVTASTNNWMMYNDSLQSTTKSLITADFDWLNLIYGTDQTYDTNDATKDLNNTDGTVNTRDYQTLVDYDATEEATSETYAELIAAYNEALAAYNAVATTSMTGSAGTVEDYTDTLTSEADSFISKVTDLVNGYNDVQEYVAGYSADEANQADLLSRIKAGESTNNTTTVDVYQANAGRVTIHISSVGLVNAGDLTGSEGINSFDNNNMISDQDGDIFGDAVSVAFTIAADDYTDRIVQYDGVNTGDASLYNERGGGKLDNASFQITFEGSGIDNTINDPDGTTYQLVGFYVDMSDSTKEIVTNEQANYIYVLDATDPVQSFIDLLNDGALSWPINNRMNYNIVFVYAALGYTPTTDITGPAATVVSASDLNEGSVQLTGATADITDLTVPEPVEAPYDSTLTSVDFYQGNSAIYDDSPTFEEQDVSTQTTSVSVNDIETPAEPNVPNEPIEPEAPISPEEPDTVVDTPVTIPTINTVNAPTEINPVDEPEMPATITPEPAELVVDAPTAVTTVDPTELEPVTPPTGTPTEAQVPVPLEVNLENVEIIEEAEKPDEPASAPDQYEAVITTPTQPTDLTITDEVPPLPDLAELPNIPEVPTNPTLGELPDLDTLPDVPNVPDQPYEPNLPTVDDLSVEAPELPTATTAPEKITISVSENSTSVDAPVAPTLPETPDNPETPTEPNTPTEPESPDTPENPNTPVTPETPDTPGNPGTPQTSSEPEKGNQPGTPTDGTGRLPQTGESDDTAAELAGVGALLVSALGLLGISKKRKKEDN